MDRNRLDAALKRPAPDLGIDPTWGCLRPRFDLHLYSQLPSTNSEAWRLVAAGAGSGTVVIAQEQTAGRGQWGRPWTSAVGGLYLSLVLELEVVLGDRALLTLATAWGITAALNRLGLPIQIKWPNDLISQGRKVGGILTETRRVNQRMPMAVVGVGLNWTNPVPETGQRLVELLPDSPPIALQSLEDLAAIALRGMLQGYYCWQQQGIPTLLDQYHQYLVNRGQSVTVAGHPATIIGVSETGHLQVQVFSPTGISIQALKPGEIQLGYNA